MDKVKTLVKIGGKEYMMTGYESEEYMHKVAIYVDHKMSEIKKTCFNLSTAMIAVLSAANIADELLKAKDEITALEEKVASLKEEVRQLKRESGAGAGNGKPSGTEAKRNAKF